jgi:hypothetical protein
MWQPPPAKLGCGEVRKGCWGGKYQTPRAELVGRCGQFAIFDIEAVGHRAPVDDAAMAAERVLSWAC